MRIGENVQEMLQCDLDLELDAILDLRAAIAYCENHKVYVSRDLFDSSLQSEEGHFDWLETQLELICMVAMTTHTVAWKSCRIRTTQAR